jgi:hypothetical protein
MLYMMTSIKINKFNRGIMDIITHKTIIINLQIKIVALITHKDMWTKINKILALIIKVNKRIINNFKIIIIIHKIIVTDRTKVTKDHF